GLVVGHDPNGARAAHENTRDAAMVRVHSQPTVHGKVEGTTNEVTDEISVAHHELGPISTCLTEKGVEHLVRALAVLAALRGQALEPIELRVEALAQH